MENSEKKKGGGVPRGMPISAAILLVLGIIATQVMPNLVLSQRAELRAPLRWIAILREHMQQVSLAATSGVHNAEDVIKLLLAGADVTMMTSVLLMHGAARLREMLDEVQVWLEEKEYDSVEQMKGSMSRANCPDPSALERGNYMKALASYTSELPT